MAIGSTIAVLPEQLESSPEHLLDDSQDFDPQQNAGHRFLALHHEIHESAGNAEETKSAHQAVGDCKPLLPFAIFVDEKRERFSRQPGIPELKNDLRAGE